MDSHYPSLLSTLKPFRGVDNDCSSYQPLNSSVKEIRCLSFANRLGVPLSVDGRIILDINHVSLDGSPLMSMRPYTALSYCWGDIADTMEITIRWPSLKGSIAPVSRTFKITRDLHIALWSLRDKLAAELFWIDQICINQLDVLERTSQVELMGYVYSRAQKIMIWLGSTNEYSELFLDACDLWYQGRFTKISEEATFVRLMHEFPEACRTFSLYPYVGQQYTTRGSCEQVAGNESEPHSTQLSRASHLLSRCYRNMFDLSWFHRIWVLQEVLRDSVQVSQYIKMYTTKRSIIWDRFWKLSIFLHARAGKSSGIATSSLHNISVNTNFSATSWTDLIRSASFNRAFGTLDILAVVKATRRFLSSDPRDKLFAILNLTREAGNSGQHQERIIVHQSHASKDKLIRPVYSKTFEQVLIDFACWHVGYTGSLRILNFKSASPDAALVGSYPSWVPNICQLDEHLPFTDVGVPFWSWPVFEVAGYPWPSLAVHGIRVACIEALLPGPFPFGHRLTSNDPIEQNRGSKEFFTFLSQQYYDESLHGPDELEFFLHSVPMLGRRTPDRRENFRHWIQSRNEDHHEHQADASSWTSEIRNFWCNHHIFTSSLAGSSPGVCPSFAEAGDLIVAFYGCSVPYLIRPGYGGPAGDQLGYQFIGPCSLYSDTWLNLDIVKYQTEHGITTEIFELI